MPKFTAPPPVLIPFSDSLVWQQPAAPFIQDLVENEPLPQEETTVTASSEPTLFELKKALRQCRFTPSEIKRIARYDADYQNQAAVLKFYIQLRKCGFYNAQIVSMVSHDKGSWNLAAVIKYYVQLKSVGFKNAEIVGMVSHYKGYENLATVVEHYDTLEAAGSTVLDITKDASELGSANPILEMVNSIEERNSNKQQTDAEWVERMLADVPAHSDFSSRVS